MSKPKSKLETELTELQQSQLADCLLAGMQYHVAIPWVKKEFGVSVSPRALSAFWDKYCAPAILSRQTRQFKVAKTLALSPEEQEEVQKGITAALLEKASALLNHPNPPAQEIFFILSQALKVRDQDLKEKQLDLNARKFQRETCEIFLKWYADKRVSELAGSAAPHSEKIEKLGQVIFGDLWK